MTYIQKDLFQSCLWDGVVQNHIFDVKISLDNFEKGHNLCVPKQSKEVGAVLLQTMISSYKLHNSI